MHEKLPIHPTALLVQEHLASSLDIELHQLESTNNDTLSQYNAVHTDTPEWQQLVGDVAFHPVVLQPSSEVQASVLEQGSKAKHQKAKLSWLGKFVFKKLMVGEELAELDDKLDSSSEAPGAMHLIADHIDKTKITQIKYSAYQDTKYEANNPEVTKRYGTFVKPAPKFAKQLQDEHRTRTVEYVVNARRGYGTNTGDLTSASLTEHQSMAGLNTFLEKMAKYQGDPVHVLVNRVNQAQTMLEKITFIGSNEYDEAAQSIADTWSEHLRNNPEAQICAVAGMIAKSMNVNMIKSDEYLLDNILKHFSDEQLEEFSGRLVLDPKDLTAEPEDTKIVMLDDWTISGSQLGTNCRMIIKQYPHYKDSIEIQLITATEQRINEGLDVSQNGHTWSSDIFNVPVNAYFAAHTASEESARLNQAHITGAHCAVDYDFNDEIAAMAQLMDIDMPPATNIVRPYRKAGVHLMQKYRLHGISIASPQQQDQLLDLETSLGKGSLI